MTESELTGFLRDFRILAERARHSTFIDSPTIPAALSEHLDAPAGVTPVLTERVPQHRFADFDIALDLLSRDDPEARLIGVVGAEMRFMLPLSEFASDTLERYRCGQVDYLTVPTGPDQHRSAVGFGIRLFRFRGTPVAAMQRAAHPRFGEPTATFEIMATDTDLAADLLAELRSLSAAHSVLRGQVLVIGDPDLPGSPPGLEFMTRPTLSESEVILPPAALQRVLTHVVGAAEHAALLRQHGQHLKRGVLLYGPAGTGKTHTVRHLLTRCQDHTVVLLTGPALQHIQDAAALARILQPAMVVLEDCDLVAEDRSLGSGAKPLLFEVLDAMDGLDADADVTFVLTTNRVEVLEHALAQRPGRVDLAVEIPLPDLDARGRLMTLYQGDVQYSAAALRDAAERTDGVTASFVRELMRRAVLLAATAGEEPGDQHLSAALDGLLAQSEELTRSLLG